MQYEWYEIIAMAVLVGVITFVVFRGMDMLLESISYRRSKRHLDELNSTAPLASQAMEATSKAVRRLQDDLAKAREERDNRGA